METLAVELMVVSVVLSVMLLVVMVDQEHMVVVAEVVPLLSMTRK